VATPGVAARPRVATSAKRAVILLVLCVEVAFALLVKGAFFYPFSVIVFVWSLWLLAATFYIMDDLRSMRAEDLVLLLLTLWWLITAWLHSDVSRFDPIGASIVCFVAAAVVVQESPWWGRRTAGLVVIALSSISAVIGIFACDLRWYPIAIRGQDLWRLASTLTYSNAAGLLLAMALLIATDRELRVRWSPLAIAACTAGLVASQSRSAVLATAMGFLLCARSEFVDALVPIGIGAFAGLVTVAGSLGRRPDAVSLCVAMLALALVPWMAAVVPRLFDRIGLSTRRARAWAVAAAGLVLCMIAVLVAHDEVLRRIDVGSDLARVREWRAAAEQWRQSIWTGVGPDRLLTISKSKGFVTYFAQNEYLQVLAGGGLVALGMLVAAMALVVRRGWRVPGGLRGARGALLGFAIAGFFDYTWHLPAIGLVAGVALGLAQPGGELASSRLASTAA